MAIPVKAHLVAGNATALGEFEPGDAVPIANGGTGAISAEGALITLGAEPFRDPGFDTQYLRGDKAYADFGDDVRSTAMAGLSVSDAMAVTAADDVLEAIGKLQAQITALPVEPVGLMPLCRVSLTTDWIFPPNTSIAVGFNTVEFDNTDAFITGNYSFKPQVAGWYSVMIDAHFGRTTDYDYAAIDLMKNGILFCRFMQIFSPTIAPSGSGATLIHMNGTTDALYLAATGRLLSGQDPVILGSNNLTSMSIHLVMKD